MPPLVDLQTDLKSLRYGNDRLGAGMSEGSGQPYIRQPIPEGSINSGLGDEDFLLRGGSLAPGAITRDVSRLEKMFTDLRSPNGILFSLKQESLSRSSVNIKAVENTGASFLSNFNPFDSNRLPLNNGLYLPTSTIAQAAVNAGGGHLLKQGVNPLQDTSESAASGNPGNLLSQLTGNFTPLSNPLYFETDAYKERFESYNTGKTHSRLVSFYDENIIGNSNASNLLYDYSGGPGSVLGVGKTRIKLSSERTGRNNPSLNSNNFFGTQIQSSSQNPLGSFLGNLLRSIFGGALANIVSGQDPGYNDYSIFKRNSPNFQGAKIFSPSTVSRLYGNIVGIDLLNQTGFEFKTSNDDINNGEVKEWSNNVFQPDPNDPSKPSFKSNSANVRGLNTTLNYEQLQDSIDTHSDGGKNNEYSTPTVRTDFRSTVNGYPLSKPYQKRDGQNIENRVNLGDPGAIRTSQRTSYSKGTGEALDEITALPIYQSSVVTEEKSRSGNPIKNDFCKFRIGVINNDDPQLKQYIHFRAFLDEMSDSYEAEWNAQKFMGRAENFYNYAGFDRTFNLSWTVVAQSRDELMPMYQKLNYLASVCAPDYSDSGYMRGNLITLTVGGYLYEQPGIMQGITYNVPEESPWEIAIGDANPETELKEVPHMIKVTGFIFKPIQRFVPSLQKNDFGAIGEVGGGALTGFGSERYISLENDLGSGYISKNIVPPVQSPTDQTQTAEQSTMFSDATNVDDLINNPSGN